jgi:hypothetical protein
MQNFNPNVDIVSKEVSTIMHKIYDDLQKMQPDLNANYNVGAAVIAFRLGLDYFEAAKDALDKGHIVSGGALARCALENLSDLFYVYEKPEKYPKAYVESMEEFKRMMLATSIANKGTDALAASRELKQANKWTDSSIDDRIRAGGNSLVNMYDLLSYFSHPNPGSLTYLIDQDIKSKQINLMKQTNSMTALSLANVVLSKTSAKSVQRQDLESIALKLDLPI